MSHLEDIHLAIEDMNDVAVFRLFHVKLSKLDVLQLTTELSPDNLEYLCSIVTA